ncbi:DUF6339 family protein [Priestia aryabhattai]|uniref:DUF6339 family protein n=1 Tax=Priestia aryabhattai TaxID=412384 RepID=UPI002E20F819|nr:DUF6339 family protein [Priestia aryabhattai]
MKIQYVSENALHDLLAQHDKYKEHYLSRNEDWFKSYFEQEGLVLDSNIEYVHPNFSFNPNFSTSDYDNVKAMYDALNHLTVAQASQERLWVGLAHLQMRDYFNFRLKEDLDKRNEKRLKSALFFVNGSKRSLFVHVLARLWWVGYMTYDENNTNDPYWLTKFFCAREFSGRSVYFFSSNFTANRIITKGVLIALKKLDDEGFEMKRAHFVEAGRYLNIVGGAMILDILDENEIARMIEARIRKAFKPTPVSV